MSKSILKTLFAGFLGFGAFMGLVFPAYAHFFVEWKSGMFAWFMLGSLLAGITIGVVNYGITKATNVP